ncbi:helix-turn-helix domain-containing protein [Duganella sp. FT135W]|uniref:Helix-turn-helix domain-containing protein n=1 Tax=Duganella flavida TaxID=2692175 RepID=A0A6L8K8Y1_9BURK|nr:AraC family transcriptional regulator [Duganella flavida]MYM22658.1 helix-turn-helix domain-containing protein [Duganella flavida]
MFSDIHAINHKMHSKACIIVAHSALLFGAGIISMLKDVGGWEVRSWDGLAGHIPLLDPATATIIVGDASMLAKAIRSAEYGAGARQHRMLLLTEADSAAQLTVSRKVDASIPIRSSPDQLINTLHQLSLLALLPAPPRRGNIDARGGLAPSVLRKVREYIMGGLTERIELADLARVARLSECHFARAFTQSVGVSPCRFVMQCRLDRALALVSETNWPFAQIALELGFCDQSHFTRMFSQQHGETPRAYRRRYR